MCNKISSNDKLISMGSISLRLELFLLQTAVQLVQFHISIIRETSFGNQLLEYRKQPLDKANH